MMKFLYLLMFVCLMARPAEAQEDLPRLQFMLNDAGKLTAVPILRTAYEFKAPKVSYKVYSPSTAPLFSPLMVGQNLQAGQLVVSDRVKLWGWGIYPSAHDDGSVPMYQMNPLLNHTGVGAGVNFKIGSNATLGIGIHYQQNVYDYRFGPAPMFRPLGKEGSAEIKVGW